MTHDEAVAMFRERVRDWAGRLRVSPRQIRIQRMSRKWASCSSSGRCSFARDLIDEPQVFQDYVIVHELLHLKIRNHGRVFRSLLSAYVPEAKQYDMACTRIHAR